MQHVCATTQEQLGSSYLGLVFHKLCPLDSKTCHECDQGNTHL